MTRPHSTGRAAAPAPVTCAEALDDLRATWLSGPREHRLEIEHQAAAVKLIDAVMTGRQAPAESAPAPDQLPLDDAA